MPAHGSERAVTQVLRYARIVEDGSLHDTGGEDDLVTGWVVVRLMSVSDQGSRRYHPYTQVASTNVDCVCRHSPFVTIRRFTQSRPFAFYAELRSGQGVSEEGRAGDVDIGIVFFEGSRVANVWALGGVAYLLYDVVD